MSKDRSDRREWRNAVSLLPASRVQSNSFCFLKQQGMNDTERLTESRRNWQRKLNTPKRYRTSNFTNQRSSSRWPTCGHSEVGSWVSCQLVVPTLNCCWFCHFRRVLRWIYTIIFEWKVRSPPFLWYPYWRYSFPPPEGIEAIKNRACRPSIELNNFDSI